MNEIDPFLQSLAAELKDFLANDTWDTAGSRSVVWENMTQTSYWREKAGVVVENDRLPSMNTARAASQALLKIRDHLLQTTGHRIYGLTFTLFPDMKCRIEYDYNPPEGFDETDDTLTLEDAVDRLQKLGVEVEVSDKKT